MSRDPQVSAPCRTPPGKPTWQLVGRGRRINPNQSSGQGWKFEMKARRSTIKSRRSKEGLALLSFYFKLCSAWCDCLIRDLREGNPTTAGNWQTSVPPPEITRRFRPRGSAPDGSCKRVPVLLRTHAGRKLSACPPGAPLPSGSGRLVHQSCGESEIHAPRSQFDLSDKQIRHGVQPGAACSATSHTRIGLGTFQPAESEVPGPTLTKGCAQCRFGEISKRC